VRRRTKVYHRWNAATTCKASGRRRRGMGMGRGDV
jgi:hypothetical protein